MILKLLLLQALMFSAINIAHLRAEFFFSRFDARGAAAVYPLDEQYPFILAMGNSTAGQFERVIQNLDDVLKIAPRHVDALNDQGVAHAILGRDKEAKERFLKVLKLSPGHKSARDNLDILEGRKEGKFNITVVWN